MITRVGIILNRKKSVKKVLLLRQFLKSRLLIQEHNIIEFPTNEWSDGIEATKKALSLHCDVIVAAGGDGTVLSVINGCVSSPAAVLVYPIGGANDVATSLGIFTVEDAMRALEKKLVITTPLLKCSFFDPKGVLNYLYAINAGAGFISHLLSHEKVPSFAFIRKYMGELMFTCSSLCYTALHYCAPNVTFKINGQVFNAVIMDVEFCKTKKLGSFSICPMSELFANQLPITLLSTNRIWTMFKLFSLACRTTTKIKQEGLYYIEKNTPTYPLTEDPNSFESMTPGVPVHLNGEYVGLSPFSIHCSSQSVELFCMKDKGN